MSRVLVTGSADGLGLGLARRLGDEGHAVTMHARSTARAHDARAAVPGAQAALVADLGDLLQVRELAAAADAGGRFDAVVHNAAVGYRERRQLTADGLEHVFAINVLAPYVLSALMDRPRRIVTLGSGMAGGGDPDLDDLGWERRRWSGSQAYADSKLLCVTLALALARRWPEVAVNAVDPGWVATKMGGPGAPDDLASGIDTQAWLVGDRSAAERSGQYLRHREPRRPSGLAVDPDFGDRLLVACAGASEIGLTGD